MTQRFNGERLGRYMKRHSLTKRAMAELLQVSPTAVYRYQVHHSCPKHSVMMKLARLTGTKPEGWMTSKPPREAFDITRHAFTTRGRWHDRWRYPARFLRLDEHGAAIVEYTHEGGEVHEVTAAPKKSGRGWLGIQDART